MIMHGLRRIVLRKHSQHTRLAKVAKPGQNPVQVVKVDRTKDDWERVMKDARMKGVGSLAIRFE